MSNEWQAGRLNSDLSEAGFDNPRFARAVYTAGLGWSYGPLLFAKLDLAYRDLGAFEDAALRDETTLRFSTGFGF